MKRNKRAVTSLSESEIDELFHIVQVLRDKLDAMGRVCTELVRMLNDPDYLPTYFPEFYMPTDQRHNFLAAATEAPIRKAALVSEIEARLKIGVGDMTMWEIIKFLEEARAIDKNTRGVIKTNEIKLLKVETRRQLIRKIVESSDVKKGGLKFPEFVLNELIKAGHPMVSTATILRDLKKLNLYKR